MVRSSRQPGSNATRLLGPGAFIAVVALTFAICAAAAIALPHQPYIRFQNLKGTIYARIVWIYERIHYDPAPINIAFLGSSRTGAGIYPTLIEPALAARGAPRRVVNFALPSTGFDIRDTIANELLSTRKVDLIVFDVGEIFPRDGHEAFGDVASLKQLATAPWLINRELPKDYLRLPLRQISLAFGSLSPQAFGFQPTFDPTRYWGSTIDPRNMLNLDENLGKLGTPEHQTKLEAQAGLRRAQLRPSLLPARFADIEFGVSRTYVERLIALAKAKKVKIAFLYLPFYKGPTAPREEVWLAAFGPVWKANFLANDPHNFEDSAHTAASPEVKTAITGWVADQIMTVLK